MNPVLRALAVGVALAGSVLVGVFVPFNTYIQLVAIAVTLAVALAVVLQSMNAPTLGIRGLLVSAVLLPVEIVTGDMTETGAAGTLSVCFLLAGLLCLTWLLRLVIVRRSRTIDPSRIVVATLVFMAAATLSFVIGQFPWFATDSAPLRAQVGGLALFLLSGGIVLVVAHETSSLSQLERMTWLFIGVGGVALFLMLIPGTEIVFGRVRVLTHSSVGSLFFTWVVAMSISQALWNRSLSTAARAAALAVGVAALARGLFVTFAWASGWLPPLVALGILILFRIPRLTVSAALLMAPPAALVADSMWRSLMSAESWSWMTRVEALRVMLQLIGRNPLLGFGPANYHYYTYLFPILSYRISFNSHNNYLDFLAQGGVLGLLVFLWFATEALRLAYRLYRRAPDGFSRAYALGTFSGVASSLVAGVLADWIVPFLYNIGIAGFRSSLLFWLFVGGLVALNRLNAEAAEPVAALRARRLPRFAMSHA